MFSNKTTKHDHPAHLDGRSATEVAKDKLIEKILTNKTYMPDSGLVVMLRKALAKLSKNDLAGLEVVINCK